MSAHSLVCLLRGAPAVRFFLPPSPSSEDDPEEEEEELEELQELRLLVAGEVGA